MNPRRRLFYKYVIPIISIVVVALGASGAIGIYFSYKETRNALLALEREKAASAAQRIEQFVKEIEHQIGWTALEQIAEGASPLELRRFDFIKLGKQVQAITESSFIRADGCLQVRYSRLQMEELGECLEKLGNDPRFVGARDGKTYFGPVYFRKETEPYMAIAMRAGRKDAGVTAVEVNLKFIWEVVQQIRIGKTGFAYVVDEAGHLVAHPDISLVLQKTDLSMLPQVKAAIAAPAAEADEQKLAEEARDRAGKAVLTAHARIATLGWTVFVEQPIAEAYQPLYAPLVRIAILLLLGLVLSILASLALARYMVRPINALREGAAAIGAGDLEHKLDVRTGDELQDLAEQFNKMAADLKESYAGLERKVEERTTELKQALEFQQASGEILASLSGSIADAKPVFDAIVRNLLRLFGTRFVVVQLLRDGKIEVAALHGETGFEKLAERYPRPLDETTVGGHVMASGKVLQLTPVRGNPATPAATIEFARDFGFDSLLGAPMIREDKVIGAIVTAHRDAVPFDDKQVALIKAFADQAVIAIENARLVNETREALEQQTATSDILRVISGSPTDVQPVFEAIAQSGLRLFEDANTWVVLRDGETIRAAAISESDPGRIAKWRAAFPTPLTNDYLNATAILEKTIVEIPDVEALPRPLKPGTASFAATGYKAVTITPMMRGNEGIGAIGVARLKPGALSEKQIALLKTFADQAVIAIENVRLFHETKEALEQQKASAEVLVAISSSITDAQPVFGKILERCERLFEGHLVGLTLVGEDGQVYLGAYQGPNKAETERMYPLPLSRDSGTGCAILDRKVVHFSDVEDTQDAPIHVLQGARTTGFRSIIFAPLIAEGRGIGALWVARQAPGPFSDKHIALLKTFADQAVIAIQNARLFREIQEKSRQLEIANKHKSDFLANMSHELRTPLNAIIGFSEVLGERYFGELTAKQDEYVKDIHSSGKHLLSLINDILDLSKIEAGRMELDLAEFDLPAALGNAMTLVKERAQRHGVALRLDAAPGLGALKADERKFKQIMLNLLSNAVKFTPLGGSVTVSARQNGSAVEIAVADTGVGIAPEDQEAVFEEFRQVGRDYSKKAEGTGLGLALTRRFIELHGGQIQLASAPGKGSTFTFTIPSRP